jgi:hypothetical protein
MMPMAVYHALLIVLIINRDIVLVLILIGSLQQFARHDE